MREARPDVRRDVATRRSKRKTSFSRNELLTRKGKVNDAVTGDVHPTPLRISGRRYFLVEDIDQWLQAQRELAWPSASSPSAIWPLGSRRYAREEKCETELIEGGRHEQRG